MPTTSDAPAASPAPLGGSAPSAPPAGAPVAAASVANTRARRTPLARFWANPGVRVAVVLLALVAAGAVLGPFCLPSHYQYPTPAQLSPPSAAHWLGTDINGRGPALPRVHRGAHLAGGRAGGGANFVLHRHDLRPRRGFTRAGRTDSLMMRGVDVLYSIPRLIFIIILINVVEGKFHAWAGGDVRRVELRQPPSVAGVFQGRSSSS